MSFLHLAIYDCELFIAAVLLWYVCEALPMPNPPKLAVQLAIAFVAIMCAITAHFSDNPSPISTRFPSLSTPNIIAPERR